MIRLAARAAITLLANAVALVVAAQILDDMALDVDGFLIAVVIFTGVAVLVEPLVRQAAIRSAPAILGSSSLIATLVSLIATTILSDGLRITGALTWVLATVAVWGVALGARFLLPLVLFKKILSEDS